MLGLVGVVVCVFFVFVCCVGFGGEFVLYCLVVGCCLLLLGMLLCLLVCGDCFVVLCLFCCFVCCWAIGFFWVCFGLNVGCVCYGLNVGVCLLWVCCS